MAESDNGVRWPLVMSETAVPILLRRGLTLTELTYTPSGNTVGKRAPMPIVDFHGELTRDFH
jgi:hypothetical protein